MTPELLRRSELLATVLLAAAGAVLALTLAAGLLIAVTEVTIPGLDELQRQGRGPVALLILAAGATGAGVLAGLGGILRLLTVFVREQADRAGGPDGP